MNAGLFVLQYGILISCTIFARIMVSSPDWQMCGVFTAATGGMLYMAVAQLRDLAKDKP